MNSVIQNNLTKVPETMLIPLRARYNETKRPHGIIRDPKSVEILDRIEPFFEGRREVSILSQMGVAVRTDILDRLTLQFLEKHPNGFVVNLGCGLDTRFHRLDNGKVTWFDLDLPEGIDLRRNFFEESERFHFVAASILDPSWLDLLPKDAPKLFIAEGLLMYFTEEEVHSLLATLAERCPRAEFIFEAMSPRMARHTEQHSDMKGYEAQFKWGIKSGRDLLNWGIKLRFEQEYFYNIHLKKMPWYVALFYQTVARRVMKIVHLTLGEEQLRVA